VDARVKRDAAQILDVLHEITFREIAQLMLFGLFAANGQLWLLACLFDSIWLCPSPPGQVNPLDWLRRARVVRVIITLALALI